MNDFLNVIQKRRSFYSISDAAPIPDDALIYLLEQALRHSPSSFHMQSARLVLLLHEEHKTLWQIVFHTLESMVPAQAFQATAKKIEGFAAGYGTVLFLDDSSTVEQYASKYEAYRDNFPIWAQQANGMLQFAVWNLLEESGLGASLQHYNPLIDEAVHAQWALPESWTLIAQMPFGTPLETPGEKTFLSMEQRMKIFQ